jgi:hypothetical protein
MSNPCGCNETIPVTSECPEWSPECADMIKTECLTLSSDLPNLGFSANEGLDEALIELDSRIGETILQTVVTIPVISVKLLNSTPYSLVLAPGSGKYVEVLAASLKVKTGGSTVYTVGGGNLQIKSTNATNPLFLLSDAALTTTNVSRINRFIYNTTGVDSVRLNESIVLRHSSGNPSLGDSEILVYMTYLIKDTN